jgi:hypothetical protein
MHLFGILALIILFLIANASIGAITYVCFGYAFFPKTFKKTIVFDLFPAEWLILVAGILFALFLWLLKKIFPERVYLVIFRSFSALFGLIMVTILVLIWVLAIKAIWH